MALHPQTRFLIPKHRRKGDYPFCQHEQHSDSFRGTGRQSKNPQVHLQRDVGQSVGSAKPSGSQWKPATALQSMVSSPFPRGVASATRATVDAQRLHEAGSHLVGFSGQLGLAHRHLGRSGRQDRGYEGLQKTDTV